MIPLSANQAAMLYLSLTLGILFALWLTHHYKSKKKVILPPSEVLFICEYCHTLYSEKTSKNVNQCPECHSYNKSNHFHPTQQ